MNCKLQRLTCGADILYEQLRTNIARSLATGRQHTSLATWREIDAEKTANKHSSLSGDRAPENDANNISMQTKDAARRHRPRQNKRSMLAIEQPTQPLTQQSDVVAIEQPTQQLDAAALNSRTSANLENVKTATQQIDVYHSPESNRISMQTNWTSHCLNFFSAIDFFLPAFIQTLKLYRQQHNRSTLAKARMQTTYRCKPI